MNPPDLDTIKATAITNLVDAVKRQYDEAVRAELVKLGWTPPGPATTRFALDRDDDVWRLDEWGWRCLGYPPGTEPGSCEDVEELAERHGPLRALIILPNPPIEPEDW